jgi:hypothetical protein
LRPALPISTVERLVRSAMIVVWARGVLHAPQLVYEMPDRLSETARKQTETLRNSPR